MSPRYQLPLHTLDLRRQKEANKGKTECYLQGKWESDVKRFICRKGKIFLTNLRFYKQTSGKGKKVGIATNYKFSSFLKLIDRTSMTARFTSTMTGKFSIISIYFLLLNIFKLRTLNVSCMTYSLYSSTTLSLQSVYWT